ncbi:hypothetical protein RDV89_10535 [Nocardioides zeae]|uniref:J domain-containing protein n=1 Tax=Nocardioides imazamoxiresistens TaxID=3231893 RepID=A0ABU3PWG3_9ACTN|nr:hypothetical protein [Nocardioides zeae]MDT9593504.1 hypothetical protein [Nocardioides zeae]
MTPGGTDPDRQRELRRARRAAAMLHHPDRGGDVDAFVRVMAALDPHAPPGTPDPAEPPAAVRVDATATPRWRRVLTRTRRRGRDAVALVRRRLPRSAPGSRRYYDL